MSQSNARVRDEADERSAPSAHVVYEASGLRSWSDVIFTFALPALIGNTLGGVALVAALAHSQIVGDKEKESSGT